MSSPFFRFGERGSASAPQHVRERYTARRSYSGTFISLLETWDRLRLRPRSHYVCFLGPALPLPEHWDDTIGPFGQHVPCRAECPYCQYELPEDHAWVPAVYVTSALALRDKPQFCFCHVPPATAEQLKLFERDLRGRIFWFDRKPHPSDISIPGPEVISDLNKTLKGTVPESFDVMPYVMRLWKKLIFPAALPGTHPATNGHTNGLNGHNGHDTNGHNGHDTNGHGHDTSEAQAHVGLKAATEAARRHFSSETPGESHS